jgi:hypothetical protein
VGLRRSEPRHQLRDAAEAVSIAELRTLFRSRRAPSRYPGNIPPVMARKFTPAPDKAIKATGFRPSTPCRPIVPSARSDAKLERLCYIEP